MLNLQYHPLTKENLPLALSIHAECFPLQEDRNAAAVDYEHFIMNPSDMLLGHCQLIAYWVIYDNGTPVGISGIYSYPQDKANAWLGWFGVLPEHRRKGIGSAVLDHFFEQAASKGFLYARLYAERDNNAARRLYLRKGFVCEKYECPEDPVCHKYDFDIFSKALYRGPLPLWRNRNLHLSEDLHLD